MGGKRPGCYKLDFAALPATRATEPLTNEPHFVNSVGKSRSALSVVHKRMTDASVDHLAA
jgi:hypothetical protein